MRAVAPDRAGVGTLDRRRHASLARRLRLAVMALLVPLLVVTIVGVVMFRSSIGALEAFRRETVDESAQIGQARELISLADDVGERFVEEGDAAAGDDFRAVSRQVDDALDGLTANSAQETAVITAVREQWTTILKDLDDAASIPRGDYTDAALDPFHDDLDGALSMLADLYTLKGASVADEIAAMRRSEQLQLVVGLVTLGLGIAMASVVARWARRSITVRLGLLEGAADRFGADNLSHRIDVGGADELTRVGDAFNEMALKLDRTRDELVRASRHNELILDSAGDGILGLDRLGRVTFANAVAQQLLDRDLGELLGKPAHQLFHHSHPDGSPYPVEECPLSTLLTDGTNLRGAQDHLVRADGSFFPIEYAATAMEEDGEVTGIVQVFRDISERRAVERMKDEFISVVSHELRTPLTSIRGSLGLLASRKLGELPPQGQRMVDIAVENTDRLIRLINDILDIERIDSGKVAMRKQECQAAEMIAQAARVVVPVAGEAGVRVELAHVEGRLWADPDRIIQTLTNLISNAVKFSPAGGVVTVAAERDGGQLRFSVSDQGRGVPQDQLETIFGRFQQVDASDAREKGGTGLGLAICRSIVEQHDGRIWAESDEGAGARFIFTVPALPEPSPVPLVTTEQNPLGPTVLVCDDDASVVEVLRAMLASHGYRSVVAGSGTEALDRARSERPAVILLDLFMPGMDGWRTFEALKGDPETAHIPVMVLSVAARDEGGVLADNVESWLTKPILDIDVLMRAIDGVVKQPRRPRVLIVEDDADLASVLIASFEHHGVQVIVASTERDALARCRKFSPDLVILDLGLPDGDGFTVMDQLRRDGRLSHVPVVVYTGQEIDEDARRRLRLGNTTIFFKSRVAPEVFEQRVMSLLDRVTGVTEYAGVDVDV